MYNFIFKKYFFIFFICLFLYLNDQITKQLTLRKQCGEITQPLQPSLGNCTGCRTVQFSVNHNHGDCKRTKTDF